MGRRVVSLESPWLLVSASLAIYILTFFDSLLLIFKWSLKFYSVSGPNISNYQQLWTTGPMCFVFCRIYNFLEILSRYLTSSDIVESKKFFLRILHSLYVFWEKPENTWVSMENTQKVFSRIRRILGNYLSAHEKYEVGLFTVHN